MPSVFSCITSPIRDTVPAAHSRWTASNQSEFPGTECSLTPLEATLTEFACVSPLLATLPRIVTFRYV